jgi:hypothetical protein
MFVLCIHIVTRRHAIQYVGGREHIEVSDWIIELLIGSLEAIGG